MNEPRDDRWSAWIDGELDPQEVQSLEAEFAADPRRRAEAEAFREQVLRLREGLEQAFAGAGELDEEPVRSSRELTASVLAAAEDAPSPSGATVHSWFAFAGATLAAAVLVGIGIWAWDTPLPNEVGRDSTDQIAVSEERETSTGGPLKAPSAAEGLGAGGVREDDDRDWEGAPRTGEERQTSPPPAAKPENERNAEKPDDPNLLRLEQGIASEGAPAGGQVQPRRVSRETPVEETETLELSEQAVQGSDTRTPAIGAGGRTRGGRRGRDRSRNDERKSTPDGAVGRGGGPDPQPNTGGPVTPGASGPSTSGPTGPTGPTGPASPKAVSANPKARRQMLTEKGVEEIRGPAGDLQRAVAGAEEPVTRFDQPDAPRESERPRELRIQSGLAQVPQLGLPVLSVVTRSMPFDADAVAAQVRDALRVDSGDSGRFATSVGQRADADGVTLVVRGSLARLAFRVPDLVRTLSDIGAGPDRPDILGGLTIQPIAPVASLGREDAFGFGAPDRAGRAPSPGLDGVGGFVVRIDRAN